MELVFFVVFGLVLLIMLVAMSFLFQVVQDQKSTIAELQEKVDGVVGKFNQVSQVHDETKSEVKQSSKKYNRLLDRCRALEAQLISNRSYDHAIRMVKGGAKLGDLVDMCGLSPGEAQLVATLHQSQTAQS